LLLLQLHPSSGLLRHRCGEVIDALASLPFNLSSFSLGFLCVTYGSRRKISTFPADKCILLGVTVEILVGFECTVDISRDSCRIMTILRTKCMRVARRFVGSDLFLISSMDDQRKPFY